MELEIRSFSKADQCTVRQLILDGLGEHFGFIDESLNSDLDDIESYYLTPGDSFLLAVRAGEIIGTGALIRESARTGRLVRMSVRRECRRMGIGQALVNHLLHLAHQRGFHDLLVETNLDWYDAIRLYQKAGFREYARDEESVHMRLGLLAF